MHLILCFLFLLLLNPFSCSADTHKLPVLKVSFEGEITPGMDYVNGSMVLADTDGAVVELPAKFKMRGATASQYRCKPSLNMKLRTPDYSEEADSALLGIRSCSSWILDAMAIDRICMRNRVAFDIWNEFSRLPYETQFDGRNGTEGRIVELYINNQYYGIYHLMDRINRKLLDLKKFQENEDGSVLVRGVLYKSGTNDILNQNEPCFSPDSSACVVEWHNAWELTYPEHYGSLQTWQPLHEAILNGKNKDYVKKYFYLQNLADYQILVMALCIADNWGNKNRFLSIRNINKDISDPDPANSDRRKFVATPWDLDTSFGGHYEGECYDGTYVDWPVNVIFNNTPYPYGYIYRDAEYLAILKQRWVEGRKGAFSPSSINEKLEHYCDLFLSSGAWQRMIDHFEAQRSRPKYVLDLSREISFIKEWYANRFREMDAYFGIKGSDTEDGITVSEELRVKDEGSDNEQLSAIYDICGRELNSKIMSSNFKNNKGMYIMNGRKVLF